MTTLLITSMGGSGSNNMVETIRSFDTRGEYRIIGTHFDPYELVKSDLEDLFIVPKAVDVEAYCAAHEKLIREQGVDVLIANSDKEVAAFSASGKEIPCKHLLPDHRLVEPVQDKYGLYQILEKQGCPVVPNVPVASIEALPDVISSLPKGDTFWIRLRNGSGSLGAAWMHTADQARRWVELWTELRGFEPEDFIVAPFLPGRDFCVALLFQDGEFAIGKAYERLRYLTGGISISNMGSTPSASATAKETLPIEISIQAVEAVYREHGRRPHGYFQLDLKCSAEGTPYVTEINIGRFPMTSPQFDRVGRYCLLELYLQMILEPDQKLPRGVFDLEPGVVMLRSVDFPGKFVRQEEVDAMAKRHA
jgi:hypothetical protein